MDNDFITDGNHVGQTYGPKTSLFDAFGWLSYFSGLVFFMLPFWGLYAPEHIIDFGSIRALIVFGAILVLIGSLDLIFFYFGTCIKFFAIMAVFVIGPYEISGMIGMQKLFWNYLLVFFNSVATICSVTLLICIVIEIIIFSCFWRFKDKAEVKASISAAKHQKARRVYA